MRRLVTSSVLTLSIMFASYAHDEEHSHSEIANLENAQAALTRQLANLEAQIANLTQQSAGGAPAQTTAAPAFPRLRHSGSVGLIPRMEISGAKNREGTSTRDDSENAQGQVQKFTGTPDANFRRLMLTWQYRLSVAVNEKLDLTFRFTDPSGNAAHEIWGSGAGSGAGTTVDLVTPRLANASFTWKAADIFHFSGGLLDVASHSALDLHAAYVRKNPTFSFINTYGNSLAGVNLSFPFNETARAFVTVGIANNTYKNTIQRSVVYDNANSQDTIGAHNEARVIIGSDLSLAENKVSLKPAVNIVTGGRTFVNNSADKEPSSVSRGNLVSAGIDAGFKIAPQFSLNTNFATLQHSSLRGSENPNAVHTDAGQWDWYSMFTAGIEPVVTFGGEKNNLFTARVRYAFETLNNTSADAPGTLAAEANESVKWDDKAGVVHFIDARFGIAVNPRFSITPRLRYWTSNADLTQPVATPATRNENWYNRGMSGAGFAENVGKDGNGANESRRSLARFEIAFVASF